MFIYNAAPHDFSEKSSFMQISYSFNNKKKDSQLIKPLEIFQRLCYAFNMEM